MPVKLVDVEAFPEEIGNGSWLITLSSHVDHVDVAVVLGHNAGSVSHQQFYQVDITKEGSVVQRCEPVFAFALRVDPVSQVDGVVFTAFVRDSRAISVLQDMLTEYLDDFVQILGGSSMDWTHSFEIDHFGDVEHGPCPREVVDKLSRASLAYHLGGRLEDLVLVSLLENQQISQKSLQSLDLVVLNVLEQVSPVLLDGVEPPVLTILLYLQAFLMTRVGLIAASRVFIQVSRAVLRWSLSVLNGVSTALVQVHPSVSTALHMRHVAYIHMSSRRVLRGNSTVVHASRAAFDPRIDQIPRSPTLLLLRDLKRVLLGIERVGLLHKGLIIDFIVIVWHHKATGSGSRRIQLERRRRA